LGARRDTFSNPIWEQIRARQEVFDGAIAYSARRYDLASGGETRFVDGLQVLVAACLAMPATGMASEKQLQGTSRLQTGHTTALLADEVRHQLVTLPYYGVFDWLEGEVLPDDTVILRGQVTQPTIKSDAEARVRSLESVAKVVNNIEVLPVSTMDDEIRLATYRAIFSYNSPLFQYSVRAVPPIHIIVTSSLRTATSHSRASSRTPWTGTRLHGRTQCAGSVQRG
jgi:hyperosmotically inducible protein